MSRFFLLLLLLVTYSANAAELPIVSAAVPWVDSEGYTPVIISVSSSIERTLNLRARSDTVEARIAMTVGGGQPVRTTLLLPPLQSYGGQIEITWSSDDGTSGDLSVSPAYAHRRLALAVIDSDESIPLKSLDFANTNSFITHAHQSYGSSVSKENLSARIPRMNLPERWQGYPSWMTLIFAASDDLALAAEQRSAIATWVAAGGTVVIATSAQREAWRKVGVEPWLLNTNENELNKRLFRIGAEKENPNVLISVPGTESVPATGFMLLATLFAVVVGPLNLWWVRRRGAPALFLLTTPALSLITCVVLLGTNIIIEGLSLRRVASQLTVLDQSHARAIAWTRASYYGGFSVARFDVDSDAKVRRFEPEQNNGYSYRGRRDNESHAIDWRGGQQLSGEWIPARRNRQLLYVTARTERAQLQLTRKGNQWQVTNGLGTALRQLTWRDGDNVVYTCGPLQTGESAELTVETHGTAIAIGDFDGAAEHAATIRNEPWGFAAELESSFGALPGPVGLDAVPLTSYVVGRLNPGSTP
jgi:hypothetical protein